MSDLPEHRKIEDFSGGWVVVETFYEFGQGFRNQIRVRPIASEGFSPEVRVQCSTKMRKKHPVGTLFRLYLYPRDAGAKPMLSARNSEYYEVVDREEIEKSNQAKRNRSKTFSEGELSKRVSWLLENPVFLKVAPAGNAKPRRMKKEHLAIQRSPEVTAWVRHNASGKCELCKREAPFQDCAGLPFLEAHHVVPLAQGGPDTVENTVAVCPNCHRALHLSGEAAKLVKKLYSSVPRLRKPTRDM